MHGAVRRDWYRSGGVSSFCWKVKVISAYLINSNVRNEIQAGGEKAPLLINIGN